MRVSGRTGNRIWWYPPLSSLWQFVQNPGSVSNSSDANETEAEFSASEDVEVSCELME